MVLKNIFFLNDFLILFFNILGIFLIRFTFLKKKILLDKTTKPQSISKNKDVVLIGGFVLIANILLIDGSFFSHLNIFFLILFLLGLASDLLTVLNAKLKFLLIFILSSIFLFINQNFLIDKLSIYFVDEFLFHFIIFKILFTGFCLTLYISGNNMIDGINGNAIGHSIIVLLVLCYVIIDKHQLELFELKFIIIFIFTLLIMLIFNFFNKIFLGDNGSYLLGGFVSLTTIYLINLYDLNPFIGSILLFYPCYEVLYAIITKEKKFVADRNHFHIRLYDILSIRKNYLPLVIIIGINSFFIFIAILNYESDNYLKIVQLLYFLFLIFIYENIKKKT